MRVYSVIADVVWFDPDDLATLEALSRAPFPLVPQWVGSVASVGAEIKAENPESALSAFTDIVAGAGLEVVRFDLGLMSISDIAEELEVSRETARLWATGQRRDGFPPRFAHVGQSQVWAWSEVYEWATRHGFDLGASPQPIPLAAIERCNGELAELAERKLLTV